MSWNDGLAAAISVHGIFDEAVFVAVVVHPFRGNKCLLHVIRLVHEVMLEEILFVRRVDEELRAARNAGIRPLKAFFDVLELVEV